MTAHLSPSTSSQPHFSSPLSRHLSLRLPLSLACLVLLLSLLPLLASAQQQPTTCGGAGLDLSPLAATNNPSLDLDLVYVSTDLHTWYALHPCGVVNETFCPAPGAMMCEFGTALAYNRPEQMAWEAYYGDSSDAAAVSGVTLRVANGDVCELAKGGPSQQHNLTVDFLCDHSVAEGKMVSVAHPSPCVTHATVRSRYACPAPPAAASPPAAGVSAQTIAVVVSVVAVAVALALTAACVVVCRRWRANGAVWAKQNGNKLLDSKAMDETEKSVELSFSRRDEATSV